MIVLLDGFVMVSDGTVSHRVDVVCIVESVVVVVVASCSYQHGDEVHVSKSDSLPQVSHLCEHEDHLSDISPVEVIMVLNICAVASGNNIQEFNQLFLFNLGLRDVDFSIVQHSQDCVRQCRCSSNILGELKYVEAEFVNVFEVLSSFRDLLLHREQTVLLPEAWTTALTLLFW